MEIKDQRQKFMRGKEAKTKPDVYAFFENGELNGGQMIESDEMTPEEALKDCIQ